MLRSVIKLYIHVVFVFRGWFSVRELVRHAIRGGLLADRLMSQGFLQSRLQAAFRKFNGRYNDLVCQYNLSFGQMLSDVFHTNR
jgi:hypothetical protein